MNKKMLELVDWNSYFENSTDYQQDIIDYIGYMNDMYFWNITIEADTLVKIFDKLSPKQINIILDVMKYDFTLEENNELELLLRLNNYNTSRSSILFEAEGIRNNNNMTYTDLNASYVLEEFILTDLSKDINLEKVIIYLNGYIDNNGKHYFRKFDVDFEYFDTVKKISRSRRLLSLYPTSIRLTDKDVKEIFITRNEEDQLDNIVQMIQDALVDKYGTMEHFNEALLE